MVPHGKNERGFSAVFDTKRTFFVTRKSAIGNKHFMHEKRVDYVNIGHKDWSLNPPCGMKRTGISCKVSIDRLFYYSGDQINVQVFLDNT